MSRVLTSTWGRTPKIARRDTLRAAECFHRKCPSPMETYAAPGGAPTDLTHTGVISYVLKTWQEKALTIAKNWTSTQRRVCARTRRGVGTERKLFHRCRRRSCVLPCLSHNAVRTRRGPDRRAERAGLVQEGRRAHLGTLNRGSGRNCGTAVFVRTLHAHARCGSRNERQFAPHDSSRTRVGRGRTPLTLAPPGCEL